MGNRVAAGRAGAVEAVVATMRAHNVPLEGSLMACTTMACMCSNTGMRCCLCADDDADDDEFTERQHSMVLSDENLARAVRARAVEAVVAIMQAHLGNTQVAEVTCKVLTIICVSPGSQCRLHHRLFGVALQKRTSGPGVPA